MIVLDTNVVSELMESAPDPGVLAWLRTQSDLWTTAITVAEIQYGIVRLPHGRRRQLLSEIADDVVAGFDDQILPFDATAAVHYATIVVGRQRAGRPIDRLDAQVAAIARAHAAPVATRNVRDFADTGVEVVDPWRDPAN